MSETDPDLDDFVRERTQRLVARSELRRLAELARSIEAEERSDARLARRIVVTIAAAVACVVLLFVAKGLGARLSLLALLVAGGFIMGAVLILWSRRRNRTLRLDPAVPAGRREPDA